MKNLKEVDYQRLPEEKNLFGTDRSYPKREAYPGNEDFGNIAWCYRDEKKARERYAVICNNSIVIIPSTNDND